MNRIKIEHINKQKWCCCLIMCLALILLSVYYCYAHSKVIISSDSTTMLLLAQDFVHGNIFLKDWVVGTNNFFFSETIFYCIAMLFGMSYQTMIMVITPVFLAAFMMFCCYMISDQQAESTQNRMVIWAGCIMFLATAALFPYGLGYTYLNANSHNLLYLWIAIAMVCLCRYIQKSKKRYIVVYMIIAVLMSFSEGVTLMVLLGPVIVASAIQFLIEKDNRKLYGKLIIFSGLSYVIAKIWLILLQHFGGLVVRGIPMTLVLSPAAVKSRIFHYSRELYSIFGFGGLHTIGLTSWNGIYNLIVFLCMCFFGIGICISIVTYLKLSILDKLLLWTVILNFAGCFFTDVAVVARYIIPSVCFGLVLSFRMTVMALNKIQWKRARMIIAIVLCVAMSFAGIYRCVEYRQHEVYGEDQKQLAKLIENEQLGDGYGDFWCASVNSFYSDFRTNIYPVYVKDDQLMNYYELVDKKWYEEKDKHYIVTFSNDGSTFFKNEELVNILGEPDRTYDCGIYQIFYWNEDISDQLHIAWT